MRQSPGLGKMESTMQKKTFFSYAIAIAGIVILSGAAVTPPLSQPYAGPRYEQRWIANDLSRPYDYRSSCANPASSDPSLDPTYNSGMVRRP
jgi:hypothetical protein